MRWKRPLLPRPFARLCQRVKPFLQQFIEQADAQRSVARDREGIVARAFYSYDQTNGNFDRHETQLHWMKVLPNRKKVFTNLTL